MPNHTHDETAVQKLQELIREVRIAMLTTLATDWTFHTRPMATMEPKSMDELWFFTAADSGKIDEIDAARRVGLSYADPARQVYVAISGTARILRDEAKARELWNPWVEAWFPAGPTDKNILLVRVTPQKAEYWDSSSHRMALLFDTMKAALGGKPNRPPGEHAVVNLKP